MKKGEGKTGSVKCPWCEEVKMPKMIILKNDYGDVRERRCATCGKILSAYFIEEGNFLESIRKSQN